MKELALRQLLFFDELILGLLNGEGSMAVIFSEN